MQLFLDNPSNEASWGKQERIRLKQYVNVALKTAEDKALYISQCPRKNLLVWTDSNSAPLSVCTTVWPMLRLIGRSQAAEEANNLPGNIREHISCVVSYITRGLKLCLLCFTFPKLKEL